MQGDPSHPRAPKVSMCQIDMGEVRFAHIRLAQVGSPQINIREMCAAQVRRFELPPVRLSISYRSRNDEKGQILFQ